MSSDIHALSGAYAVDALNDLERAHFERHLAECADCQAEVAGIREASAMLAETSATTAPPALRDSVLSGIKTVRPLPPQAPEGRSGLRARRFPALLAAAAAVVAVGVGTTVTQPWSDDRSDSNLSAAERVIEADDARHQQVKIDGATATLYHSASRDQAALVTEDLPPAPAGKVYELWLMKDGSFVPAGLVTDSGDVEFLLQEETDDATAAGITIEPAGGSTTPTTAPIAMFDMERLT